MYNTMHNLPILILLAWLILNPTPGIAQTIRGSVKDTLDKKPVEFATVAIFKTGDVVKPLKTSYTDKYGDFSLTGIPGGEYHVVVHYIGYQQKVIPVTMFAGTGLVDIDTVFVRRHSEQLNEVTIFAIRPLIEVKHDALNYNVEADPMGNADKAIDILRKTPMVSVDGDDNVELNGQRNFKILLNGKESQFFSRNQKEALKSYTGSNIKRIEVITVPSAKYDAEGISGIINIITTKDVLGYSVTISAEANTAAYKNTSGSLNLKHGRTGFTANYSAGGTTRLEQRLSDEITSLVSSTSITRTGDGVSVLSSSHPSFSFELSRDLDTLNSVFSVYGSYNGAWAKSTIGTKYLTAVSDSINKAESSYQVDNYNASPGGNIGFDYVKRYKNNGQKELSIKAFNDFGINETENKSQLMSDASGRFVNNDSQAKDLQYTVQTDLVMPLKNLSKLELGAKTIFRRAQSDYLSYIKFNPFDTFHLNAKNSDQFTYRQNVYGLYASYSFSISTLNFTLGLRSEHTKVYGDFMTSKTIVNQLYTNVIPNILASHSLKNGASVLLGYNLRLSRPYIRDLNPFINNADSLLTVTGNPGLNPQIFHNTNLQYRFSKGSTFVNMNLAHSYSRSYILQVFTLNKTTGVSTLKPQNGGISNSLTFSAGLNANLYNRWQSNINSKVSYISISSVSDDQHRQNQGFTGNISYNTSIRLNSRIYLASFFNYNFPSIFLQGGSNKFYSYGSSSRFNLLNNKLTMVIYANNIFNKDGLYIRKSTFTDISFRQQRTNYNVVRSTGINLTWNFGKLKDNVSKKKGIRNDDLL
jgi:hypothetical protein